MLVSIFLLSSILAATSVTITKPVDGETYDGDWLTISTIVENENEVPDSVHYSLNGETAIAIPKLSTDWPTYMQNYQNHGFSESPAPTDNTILWTAPVTGDYHEFPTPVIVDGIVYYPSNFGNDSLYALDAATGELIWKYRVGMTDDAVTVHEGIVYSASDSLYSLDAYSGSLLWATDQADWRGSTPIVYSGKVYAGTRTGSTSRFSCLDSPTGSVLWVDTLGGSTVSCCALSDGVLYIPSWGYASGSLYALDAENGAIIWENDDSDDGYWDSSPVVVDGVVYICGDDGIARGINASDGITIWEQDISAGVWYLSATMAYAYENLFFGDQVDSYHCLSASNGLPVWSVPGVQHGSSGVADGIVFFGESADRNYGKVRALSCDSGAEIWSYQTGGDEVFSSPSITDGVVYIAGMDWNLYAFGTGLKYTYLDHLYAQVGMNELIVTSFDGGTAVAADTINFTVTQTGITLEPSSRLVLCASPNPFYSTALISFELSELGWTSVTVYDLSGRIVRTLENSELGTGQHSIVWDGRRQNGESVSAGLYLCRIQSGGVTETTGLCLLR